MYTTSFRAHTHSLSLSHKHEVYNETYRMSLRSVRSSSSRRRMIKIAYKLFSLSATSNFLAFDVIVVVAVVVVLVVR
jgi:hypothetical protein